jgi:polyhydroxyalkanoate synthesis regulator phasin
VDKSLEERKRAVEEIIEQLESRRREAEKNYNDIITNEKEKINTELEFYRKTKIDGMKSKLQFEFAEKIAAANKVHEETIATLNE